MIEAGEAAWQVLRARLVTEVGWQNADPLIGETRLRLADAGEELRLELDPEGIMWISTQHYPAESTAEGFEDAIRKLGSRIPRPDEGA